MTYMNLSDYNPRGQRGRPQGKYFKRGTERTQSRISNLNLDLYLLPPPRWRGAPPRAIDRARPPGSRYPPRRGPTRAPRVPPTGRAAAPRIAARPPPIHRWRAATPRNRSSARRWRRSIASPTTTTTSSEARTDTAAAAAVTGARTTGRRRGDIARFFDGDRDERAVELAAVHMRDRFGSGRSGEVLDSRLATMSADCDNNGHQHHDYNLSGIDSLLLMIGKSMCLISP
jgi:hypothetical protein